MSPAFGGMGLGRCVDFRYRHSLGKTQRGAVFHRFVVRFAITTVELAHKYRIIALPR